MAKQLPVNILIVDDRPENLLVLEHLLAAPDICLIKAASGNEALGLLLEHDIALALLDVQMPEMDGFETAEIMRGNRRTQTIPIIFVTAISKEQKHVFKGYASGAVDYLFKPIEPRVLESKVRVFIELYRQRRALEHTLDQLERTVSELQSANRQLLDRQKDRLEEERLNLLLQLAGARASEIDEPLSGILQAVEALKSDANTPDGRARLLMDIETAGRRLAAIARNMQATPSVSAVAQPDQNPADFFDTPLDLICADPCDADMDQIESLLAPFNQLTMRRAHSIRDAIDLLERKPADLLLTEYELSDGNALALIDAMRAEDMKTPAMAVTGQGDEVVASRLIQSGVYEYLPKSRLSANRLQAAICSTMEKARIRKDAETAVNKMAELSIRDALTGLYNRRHFEDVLKREISRSRRYDHTLALCMMDLDHFKRINDRFGHPAGDTALCEFAELVQGLVRASDIVCRYGGEEFAVILPETEVSVAAGVCERFRQALDARTICHENRIFQLTVSIGLAAFAGNGTDAAALVQMADDALYAAKSKGRNQVRIFKNDHV